MVDAEEDQIRYHADLVLRLLRLHLVRVQVVLDVGLLDPELSHAAWDEALLLVAKVLDAIACAEAQRHSCVAPPLARHSLGGRAAMQSRL